jgi:hypothetical protein
MASPYRGRIDDLADRARRDREAFDPPVDPPDEQRAMDFLREGVGEAVAIYVDARSEEWDRFDREEFALLEAAMNDYFELYACCYGVDIEAEFSVREAAEALLDTHNIHDVAVVLTGVPEAHRPGG